MAGKIKQGTTLKTALKLGEALCWPDFQMTSDYK